MATPKDPDVLGRALRKQAAGYGTSNSEKRAIYDFQRGRIARDHFQRLAVYPAEVRMPRRPLEAAPNGTLQGGIDTLRARDGGDGGEGQDVIAALIASGATFVEKTGCDSGTPYTYWAPEWTTDPTP